MHHLVNNSGQFSHLLETVEIMSPGSDGDPNNAREGSGWLDCLQTTLDLAGVADPTGIADLANAAIYAG